MSWFLILIIVGAVSIALWGKKAIKVLFFIFALWCVYDINLGLKQYAQQQLTTKD
jgi:hypothetical protein